MFEDSVVQAVQRKLMCRLGSVSLDNIDEIGVQVQQNASSAASWHKREKKVDFAGLRTQTSGFASFGTQGSRFKLKQGHTGL